MDSTRLSAHGAGLIALAALLLSAGTLPAWAQTVHTGDGQVVIEGDYVHIDSAGEEVDVDWRSGAVHVRDGDDDVLIELGAVRGSDYIRVPLAGDVLFEFGKAAITEAAADSLAKLAQVIRHHAVGDVLVVGHTDSMGDDEVNQRLSEARAVSVIRWLNGHEGIPSHMLLGRGMGERQPIAPNRRDGQDDPVGRARNRRVEVVLGTTADADVRAIANQVTIRDDHVSVAGVDISSGGLVRIAQAAGSASAVGGQTVCSAGKTCKADCPEGKCRMACSAGAICTFACSGGGCAMSCASGANGDFSCSGGGCRFEKAIASHCRTSCSGGGCSG